MTLEKYKEQLKNNKKLNRHERRRLLAITTKEFIQDMEKQHEDLKPTKEDLKSIQPLPVSRCTTSSEGYNWETKYRLNKGYISRKCHTKA